MANVNPGDTVAQVIQPVVGDTLAGATDSGSEPVKAGGIVNSADRAYTNGQRAELRIANTGELYVRLRVSNADIADVRPNADAIGSSTDSLAAAAFGLVYNGASWDRQRTAIVFKNIAGVAVTAGTPVTVWTPTAGKKFRLMGAVLMCATAVRVAILKDGGAEFLRTAAPVNAAFAAQLGNGILSAAANNALTLDLSVSDTVHGFVFGTEE